MRSFLLALFLAVPAFAQPVEIVGRAEVPPQCGPARVALFPARPLAEQARLRLAGKDDDRALASARVRADGWFAITAPEAGLFRVVIEAKGCVPVEQTVVAALELELPPAPLELARPLEILVLGADGQPAAGVPVAAGPPVREDRGVWPVETFMIWRAAYRHGISGEDGRLVLQRGDEEPWGLDLWAPGVPFTAVAPREQTRTLRIEERPHYRLLVRSAAGGPLPGALARWGSLPLAVSGPDGRLEVAMAGGEPLVVEGPAGEVAEVYLPKTGDKLLEVVLTPPPLIKGRIVDAASRMPLADAVVWSIGPPAVRSAADGTFTLPLRAGRRRQEIAGAAAGYLPESFVLQEGREPVLALLLATGIRGTVSEAGGRPIAGVEVSAQAADWFDGSRFVQRHVRTWTSADGSFRLLGLPAGILARLVARKAGYASAERLAGGASTAPVEIVDLGPQTVAAQTGRRHLRIPIEIRPGTQSLDLRFAPAVRVSGRVIDAAGAPVADATVYLGSEDGDTNKLARTLTGPDGTFVLEAQDGTYRLTADARGFAQGALPDPMRVDGRDLEGLELRLAPEETSPPAS